LYPYRIEVKIQTLTHHYGHRLCDANTTWGISSYYCAVGSCLNCELRSSKTSLFICRPQTSIEITSVDETQIVLNSHSRLPDFYRATLCVSAVLAVGRCASVCPSITLVYCIQTTNDIVKLLWGPASPILLVFLSQSGERRNPV